MTPTKDQIKKYYSQALSRSLDAYARLDERDWGKKASVEEHLAMLEGLSEADLDKPFAHPGWDRPGTLRDQFFSSYLHLPGHYQDIRRAAKKKLPPWMETSRTAELPYHPD